MISRRWIDLNADMQGTQDSVAGDSIGMNARVFVSF